MTWTIVSIIVISLIKILMTCLPTPAAEWLVSKFELHAKLNNDMVTVTINQKELNDKDKQKIVAYFNEANFLEKYYVHPGNEPLFLNPEQGSTPIVIKTKRGKKSINYYLFSCQKHVDVIRQIGKKVVAYSVSSKELQKQLALLEKEVV